jgi:hypothetical protein
MASARFVVAKSSVRLESGEILKFDRRIADHRVVKDVLILLFKIAGPDAENVLALDRAGNVLWRKPSWLEGGVKGKRIRLNYVEIRSSPDSVYLYTFDCSCFRVRPRTGKVARVTFTK